MCLYVRVKPRSSKSAVEGLHGDRISVSLHSPPEKGKANKELLRLISKALGVPTSSLEILSGVGSRHKTVLAKGITLHEAAERLGLGDTS